MRAEEIVDEDDWVEIEKTAKTGALPDVSVKVTVAAVGRSPIAKARAYLAFRGEAAKWIVANGPRFRVAIGGDKANFLRIAPDMHRGKFEFGESTRGDTKRMNLGCVTAWPGEERVSTAAHWEVSGGFMRLRLPDEFAVARAAPVAPKIAPVPPVTGMVAPNIVARFGNSTPSRPAIAKRG